MLPLLPQTDLLTQVPDVKDIELWSNYFSWDQIPGENGCYAFYTIDGEIVYIGAATASSHDIAQRGLRMRLRFYRGRGSGEKPTSTVIKIRKFNNSQRLLLKCWICKNAGDCKKYEDDALRKYKPKLNFISTRCISHEQHKARKRGWQRNYKDKMSSISYNPDIIKKCPKCGQIKKCSEFAKNKYRKYGVKSHCKECVNKHREELEDGSSGGS